MAWTKLGIGTREKPGEIFPKFNKKDFDDLKDQYNKLYGYTIRIPQFDEIIHLTPDALKSDQTIKAEKKEALVRILESPAPDWARKYSTVMTWIDDIQDTASVVYPLLHLAFKVAPKFASKWIPIAGWLLAGYDILNLLNAIGRAPLTGMKAKRDFCTFFKQNPFGFWARYERAVKIRNWKPNWADAIQAAQVLDQFTGMGLSLGSIMGLITDSAFGAYRYVTGQPVRFSFDPPDIGTLELMGSKGLKAAAAISSQGQVFSENQHFWTYVTASLSAMALSGTFIDEGLTDLVEDPMNIVLPAPEPKNPFTISVIEEMGLKVEDGVGWPFNGKKFISVNDYLDSTAEPCRSNFISYCIRHSKDSYGLVAAYSMNYLIPAVISSIEPDSKFIIDDTTEMKIFWKMVKAPLLPTGTVTKEQSDKFWAWVNDITEINEKEPGIQAIQEKFDLLGIKYITSYPDTPGPDFLKFWPEGWTGNEAF
jgi:hypothetical protein